MVWTCDDENWVNKCMEIRVEGRRPVGIPRKTWLDNLETDMAELEIDRENIHDMKKWRQNVMKRKSNTSFSKINYFKIQTHL